MLDPDYMSKGIASWGLWERDTCKGKHMGGVVGHRHLCVHAKRLVMTFTCQLKPSLTRFPFSRLLCFSALWSNRVSLEVSGSIRREWNANKLESGEKTTLQVIFCVSQRLEVNSGAPSMLSKYGPQSEALPHGSASVRAEQLSTLLLQLKNSPSINNECQTQHDVWPR